MNPARSFGPALVVRRVARVLDLRRRAVGRGRDRSCRLRRSHAAGTRTRRPCLRRADALVRLGRPTTEWPREESNLRPQIRSLPLYPLSYGAGRSTVARSAALRRALGLLLVPHVRDQHPYDGRVELGSGEPSALRAHRRVCAPAGTGGPRSSRGRRRRPARSVTRAGCPRLRGRPDSRSRPSARVTSARLWRRRATRRRAEDAFADERVLADEGPLALVERPGLLEDLVGHRELPEIVQLCCPRELFELVACGDRACARSRRRARPLPRRASAARARAARAPRGARPSCGRSRRASSASARRGARPRPGAQRWARSPRRGASRHRTSSRSGSPHRARRVPRTPGRSAARPHPRRSTR